MPHPLIYTGTQDDDKTRSADVVHIEPSIREGVHLVSSIYGPEASSPVYRFAPTNVFPPYLTGPQQIPGRLVCNSGQWQGSPTPVLFYQWMADGVDIPGANQYEFFTTEAQGNTVITCEVRGANYLGEEYAVTSNSIAVSLIEPIEMNEMGDYLITGLAAPKIQTTHDERTTIITGVAADNRQDINRGVAYFLTGISANNRQDINAMNMNFITGLPQSQLLSVLERDWGIGVISWNIGEPLIDGVPQAMDLKNPEAEFGMLGWDIFGEVGYEGDTNGPEWNTGRYSWHGGYSVHAGGSNTPYSYMWQDVPIFAVHEVDVDAGSCYVIIDWYQFSEANLDQGNIKVEFYGANDVLTGSFDGPGLWAAPNDIFFHRSIDHPIPPNTRYIRIIPEFNLQDGNNNDAQIDSISMMIRKGNAIGDRDFGPNFERWRIRFTMANTWSGTALSELEFRDGIGGSDLSTGGQPIFGSAGLGVTNADYAFDDLRNTGYWAGGENAVTEGTAWIGYDMQTPVKPLEIDITARTGTNSLQVGREFYLEGSDDGIRWTTVQYVPEERLGTFSSGQQKQITIGDGPYDYYRNLWTGGGYTFNRNLHGSDDYKGKGNVYQAHARIDIIELSVRVKDNSLTAFPCRIQLIRLNTQKNGSYGIGMVEEILEDIAFNAPGTNSGHVWMDFACSQTHSFEVGDYFLIRFYDIDTSTNPDDTAEGRTTYLSTNYNGELDPYQIKGGLAKFVDPWIGGGETLTIGDVNPNGYTSGSNNWQWAIDFKGSTF